jgi:hypothetical protein
LPPLVAIWRIVSSPTARFPGQEAEVRATFPFDQALVGLVLAEDDVEERGLAGPVGADEAEAVGPGDVQRHVREQGARAVGLGDVGNREHRKGDKGANVGEVKGRLGDRLPAPSRGHVGTSRRGGVGLLG